MVCFVVTQHSESALSLCLRYSKTSCEATPQKYPFKFRLNSDDPMIDFCDNIKNAPKYITRTHHHYSQIIILQTVQQQQDATFVRYLYQAQTHLLFF